MRAACVVLLVACGLATASALKVEETHWSEDEMQMLISPVMDDAFQSLAMIELEAHEDTDTAPFSVCKYLLETSAQQVTAGDKWPEMAKKIADVRETLPEHVRSSCDHFIKEHSGDITSMLELAVTTGNDDIENFVDNELSPDEDDATAAPEDRVPKESKMNQQEVFKKFWEEKGKYCGACLTLTKKIHKWLSLNCTQRVIGERVMRMCGQMPGPLKAQCEASEKWIVDYVLKELFLKFPLPNHCAYIGLCEKTMVIRALQNPLVEAEAQDALIQELGGTEPNLVQEDQLVLQKPHATVNTAPEVTFDLGGENPAGASITYRDVDKSLGDGLPKMFMDGHHESTDLRDDAFSLLETESQTSGPGLFDLSNPNDPHVTVHAQDEDKVHVPIMHGDLKKTTRVRVQKNYGFQENHLPIETKWLKGCAACQFTLSALFEFLSNPRTIRTMLPAVKHACQSCNNAEEVKKCEDLVEQHGVAFYQDVVRQGTPQKWCPRLQLCEIQYFQPSPHVLADTYGKVKEDILKVSDF